LAGVACSPPQSRAPPLTLPFSSILARSRTTTHQTRPDHCFASLLLRHPPSYRKKKKKGMAAAVSFSRLRALPTWSSSVSGSGDDHHSSSVLAMSVSARARPRSGARPLRSPAQMMGNVNAGKGLFAPLVVVARNIIGRKRFNQLRGKAIALHSQVITEFCKTIGADSKQRQGLIRLAKKNGEKLGFLA
ncbi:Protein PROTON GRADIENT REGULATION 5, chloroplastic, partial [Dichanthelium oligosanthes]